MVLLSARDSVVAQHAWCGKLVPMLVDVATVLDGRGSVRDAACAALAIIAVCNQVGCGNVWGGMYGGGCGAWWVGFVC